MPLLIVLISVILLLLSQPTEQPAQLISKELPRETSNSCEQRRCEVEVINSVNNTIPPYEEKVIRY